MCMDELIVMGGQCMQELIVQGGAKGEQGG
jgi:hypothetical protein